MKMFATAMLMLLCLFNVQANSLMQEKLVSEVNTELSYSDGYIKNINCSPYYTGVYCLAELEFIDYDSTRASALNCVEAYTYVTGKKYEVVCSDCWFNAKEPFYNKSCK